MPQHVSAHLDPCTARWIAEAEATEPGIWEAMCQPSRTWFHRPTIGMGNPLAIASRDDMLGRDELDQASFSRNPLWGDSAQMISPSEIAARLQQLIEQVQGPTLWKDEQAKESLEQGELFPEAMARSSAIFAAMMGRCTAIPLPLEVSAAGLMFDALRRGLEEATSRRYDAHRRGYGEPRPEPLLRDLLEGLLPGLRASLAAGFAEAGASDPAPRIGLHEQDGLPGAMAWDAALPLVIGQGWQPWAGREQAGLEALAKLRHQLMQAEAKPLTAAQAARRILGASFNDASNLLRPQGPRPERFEELLAEWLRIASRAAAAGQVVPALISTNLLDTTTANTPQERHAALSTCAWTGRPGELLACLSCPPKAGREKRPSALLLRVRGG